MMEIIWHNIEDGLPDKGIKVLVYCEAHDINGDVTTKYISESRFLNGRWSALFYHFHPDRIKKWAYFEYPDSKMK